MATPASARRRNTNGCCVGSISAPTTRDFHWVVYFDMETPPEFRELIEACRAVFPFVPYFTEFFQAEGWPRSLREPLGQPTPWLLTTRFDSDDALAVDHAARLQVAVEAAAPTTRTSFNLIHGSDSPEAAETELALFFQRGELVDYSLLGAPWVYDKDELR